LIQINENLLSSVSVTLSGNVHLAHMPQQCGTSDDEYKRCEKGHSWRVGSQYSDGVDGYWFHFHRI
jgi:hypothetical protein